MLSKRVLLIIPARKKSERIANKNTLVVRGKPLIEYTIMAAKGAHLHDRLVISTDDESISNLAGKFGIEAIKRPPALARSDSKSIDVVMHVLKQLKEKKYLPDVIVLLQPTSPLRTSEDIDTAISMIVYGKADSVMSVTEIKPNPKWGLKLTKEGMQYLFEDHAERRSQELERIYAPNGAIYAARIDTLIKTRSFIGENHCPLFMSRERSIDIDDYQDIVTLEKFLSNTHL